MINKAFLKVFIASVRNYLRVGLGFLMLWSVTTTVNAGVVLQDNFNAENGGVGVLNFAGFSNWNLTRGSLDLIGNGVNDFYPGNGLYVDLDGSTGQGGRMESKALFALDVGEYELRFTIGNNNLSNVAPNTATITLGGVFSENFTRQGHAPAFETIVRSIAVGTATTGRLIFDQAGGDNHGIIIDNVLFSRIEPVPEPSSLILLGLGLFGTLSVVRGRRVIKADSLGGKF